MEITIPREKFFAKLLVVEADSIKIKRPTETHVADQGYIDYPGVSIGFKILSDTLVSFLIVSRQDGIAASTVRGQILKWFG